MFANKQKSLRFSFLACLISFAMLFCIAAPSQAETSPHKLKRKLHKSEKVAGEVLGATAAITFDVAVIGVAFALQLDLDLDDLPLLEIHLGGEHKWTPGHGSHTTDVSQSHEAAKKGRPTKEHARSK